jgi:hypothetical protein
MYPMQGTVAPNEYQLRRAIALRSLLRFAQTAVPLHPARKIAVSIQFRQQLQSIPDRHF